jgi:predicted nucleic acid-binding protein
MSFMGRRVFFDTNVLIYARTHQDRAKQAVARAWIGQAVTAGAVFVNRQVLNELTAWVLRREPARPPEIVREEIEALASWGCEPVTDGDVRGAWAIRAQTGFQWYDCLLLAAAHRAGCGFFLSEDMTDGLRIGDVTIINPFVHPPQTILVPG